MATQPNPAANQDPANPQPSVEDRLKALNAELAAERAKNTGVDELKQTVEQLNARLTQALTPPPAPPPKPDEPDFFVDPKAATLATVKPAFDALALNQLRQNAYLARQAVSQQGGEIGMAFRKWSAEIDELTKNDTNLASKGETWYWVNAAKIVLANHLSEITGAAKSGKDFFLEGGAPGVAPGGGNESRQRRAVTDQEREAIATFKRMGVEMSEEEYLESQEEIMSGVRRGR